MLSKGAREHSPGHYPLIVAVHASWLIALWWLAPSRPVDGFWLAMFVLLELARIWVLQALGPRWTTRIIAMPNEPLVRRGPYRFVNHPNYLVVVGEIAVLPLVFGLWQDCAALHPVLTPPCSPSASAPRTPRCAAEASLADQALPAYIAALSSTSLDAEAGAPNGPGPRGV